MSDGNLNVKDLLFDSNANVADETRAKMEKDPEGADLKAKVAKQSKLIKWNVVSDVLIDRATEMSDIPLAKILLPAWKKFRDVEKFGDPQAYPPEDTELVSLMEHTVKSEHKSSLEILLKGVKPSISQRRRN
jgi:hypothetical protein